MPRTLTSCMLPPPVTNTPGMFCMASVMST